MNRIAPPKTPKYWQLVEQFREQIGGGTLKPGDKLPSLAEMKEQGISRPVMEKVHQILEQEGLILRQPGAGTFVLEPRRRTTTGTLGVCGYGFAFIHKSSYWSSLLGGIREAALARGQQILHLEHSSPTGWEKADGVLMCDWSASEHFRYLPPALPCVSVMVGMEGVPSVYADDTEGSHQATQYLISQGHRRIAYLHGRDRTLAPKRIAGYQNALREAGIEQPASWMRQLNEKIDYGAEFIEAGHRAMAQWIAQDWKELGCTALLAHNDECAIGVIAALREEGINVPGQVSVIGFDGLQISDYVSPALTTVEVPLMEIGKLAVDLLLNQIEADNVGGPSRVLPTKLRLRGSHATHQE